MSRSWCLYGIRRTPGRARPPRVPDTAWEAADPGPAAKGDGGDTRRRWARRWVFRSAGRGCSRPWPAGGATGLSRSTYLLSKVIVLGVITALQGVILSAIGFAPRKLPTEGVISPQQPAVEMALAVMASASPR